MEKLQHKMSYCGALVKKEDPDRFFLSLFAPHECREALWALYAFNHEIAKTREVVTETQLGLIRLQWWREEVGGLYEGGKGDAHEILRALKPVITAYDLPKESFEALIYAREFELEDVLPETLAGTLMYVEATSLPLMQLLAKIIGAAEDENLRAVAMNYGLIGLLRATPFHLAQGRCYLPEDRLTDQGINPYALYNGKDHDKMTSVAQALLNEFQPAGPKHKVLKAFQAQCEIYRRHVIYHGYDVVRMAQEKPPYFKELRMFLKTLI